MKKMFNSISKKNNRNNMYDFSRDSVNKLNREQILSAVYAPKLNAKLISKMIKSGNNTINTSSLLEAGSFLKF
jgi:hypothetical protein